VGNADSRKGGGGLPVAGEGRERMLVNEENRGSI